MYKHHCKLYILRIFLYLKKGLDFSAVNSESFTESF